MSEPIVTLLNGKWEYITDKDIKLSFKKASELYKKDKINGRMNVRSNWEKEGLENFRGAVWFFKEFNSIGFYSLYMLEFNGVDYFADIWLNGSYIGNHEGYFQKFFFDITKCITHKNNLLIVKVTSPKEKPGTEWPHNKKLIKGIFNHHDCRPGGWSLKYGQDQNTGGIWNDVKIVSSDSVYVSGLKINTRLNKDFSSAQLFITLNFCLNSKEQVADEIKLIIISPSNKKITKQYKVKYSANSSLDITITVDQPELWWTWDIGKPDLYTIEIKSKYIKIRQSFGIREVKLGNSGIFYLNNKKLFLRGTNIIPEQFLSILTEKRINNQIKLLKDANINTIRMHAHINRQEYYDICDREGILIWQDFALQWTYDTSAEFESNAARQIKEMVSQLYNHPSIAFWCCHNEPGNQIKSLDLTLRKVVKSIDNNRVIRIASNFEEHPYDGWYWGNKEHFAACPMGPLVTEFGAQAIPDLMSLKQFLSEPEISKPDWRKWRYHNFQYEQTFHVAVIEYEKDIRKFIRNSQNYQAGLLTTAIDFYRREKFNKCSALFQFMFIDCWPSITWSVVDYYGRRKAGYFALKRVFQPLFVSVKLMRRKYFAGQKLDVSLWIINDLHKSYIGCNLELISGIKLFAAITIPEVKENSVEYFPWEKNKFFLPKNISRGNHKIVLLLKDNSGKVISINEFHIEIDKKPDLYDE